MLERETEILDEALSYQSFRRATIEIIKPLQNSGLDAKSPDKALIEFLQARGT